MVIVLYLDQVVIGDIDRFALSSQMLSCLGGLCSKVD